MFVFEYACILLILKASTKLTKEWRPLIFIRTLRTQTQKDELVNISEVMAVSVCQVMRGRKGGRVVIGDFFQGGLVEGID